jgi:catechol 2,3-dioxygenase-like lactoylglutathione lyase family enzyme
VPTTSTASLHHTGLTVSDLERALAFWCDALGGSVLFRQEREGGYFAAVVGEPQARVRMAHVELEPAGHRIEIFQFDAPAAGSHRLRPADVGFAHLCVTTADLGPLLVRLEAAGGTRVSDPVAIDTGVNAGGRAVYVRDPDGHVVELFQPGTAER